MSEFFLSYGLFIAKVVTGLISLVFVLAIIGGSRKKEQGTELKVTNLNEKYNELKSAVLLAVMDKKEFKQQNKKENKEKKKDLKLNQKSPAKPKLFVLEFDGDIKSV